MSDEQADRAGQGDLDRALEHRLTRSLLAGSIVVSLLPFAWVGTLQTTFLVVFGVELSLRLGASLRRRGDEEGEGSSSERLFLLVDLLAWVSFLPLDALFGLDAAWLRGLRLVRLLMLFRLGRPLLVDLWRVLTRREQLQQLGLVTAAVVTLSFLSAIVLTQLAIGHDYDGVDAAPEDFWDRVWWSFRQVESPDNLVSHLGEHPLVLLVSLGLTISGIFVFSYLIGVGTTVVEEVLRAERRRPVPFRSHTLVIGPIAESEPLVREFVGLYEKNRAGRRISVRAILRWLFHPLHPRPRRYALPRMALLGPEEQPPAFLYEPTMRWVVHRRGGGDDPTALALVGAEAAKRAVLVSGALGSPGDPDARTVTALAAFRGQNDRAQVFVEVRESANADVVRALGGPGTYPLDVSRVLGLFLAQYLLAPGVERIFQELLSASGHELYTHVFLDPAERLSSSLDFAQMRRRARQSGVLLLGAFEGEPVARTSDELIPAERLSSRFLAGSEPLVGERLQGVFGIALNYDHLRRVTEGMRGPAPEPASTPLATALRDQVDLELAPRPQRVTVVGYDPALRSFAEALARVVEGLQITVVMGDDRLGVGRRARLGLDGEGTRSLEQGGRVDVRLEEPSLLPEHAARLASGSDAVVFLSDERESEADAHTLLRVLRFAAALGHEGPPLRCLIEVETVSDPAALETRLRALSARLRPIFLSTERLTRYFLVHSAFVPGVTGIYERLLDPRGYALLRLPLAERAGDLRAVTFDEVLEAFAPLGALPVALEVREGGTDRVLVNPPRSLRFERRVLGAVFVVADREAMRRRFAVGA